MPSKFIIENKTDLSDMETILLIRDVINMGRISNDGKQYCYATKSYWHNVIVYTYLNKKSDRFVIEYGNLELEAKQI